MQSVNRWVTFVTTTSQHEARESGDRDHKNLKIPAPKNERVSTLKLAKADELQHC